MAVRNDWIKRLADAEIADIEAATKGLVAFGMDPVAIRSEDFPLPLLPGRLQRNMDEVLDSRSFATTIGGAQGMLPISGAGATDPAASAWGHEHGRSHPPPCICRHRQRRKTSQMSVSNWMIS
jgi:hypothetical protein